MRTLLGGGSLSAGEVSAEAGEFCEGACKRAGATSSVACVADQAVEQIDFRRG